MAAVKARCAREGVNPGVDIHALTGREADRGGLLVAITERRTRADIDRLADVLGRGCGGRASGGGGVTSDAAPGAIPRGAAPAPAIAETPLQRDRAKTIFEKGAPGRRAFVCPELDVPPVDPETLLPARYRRGRAAPAAGVLRARDRAPLRRDVQAQLRPGLGLLPARIVHDEAQPASARARGRRCPGTRGCTRCRTSARAQGALELMWQLQGALAEIAGLPHVSLQPSAGSHGELAGSCSRAPITSRGAAHRLQGPDTRHRARHQPSDGDDGGPCRSSSSRPTLTGGIDLDDLRAKADTDVACLMLTNPNTLGMFDSRTSRRSRAIVHGVGATLYYDGANLNAVMGHLPARATWGSTSSTTTCTSRSPSPTAVAARGRVRSRCPSGSRRSARAVRRAAGRRERCSKCGPARARVVAAVKNNPRGRGERGRVGAVARGRSGGPSSAAHVRPRRQITCRRSGGCASPSHGNYGCCVRAYAYICSLGADGLRDASETAVLNANYLLARLREAEVAEYLPLAYGELCMHEFVLSGRPDEARASELKTLDLAKRLLDYGFHPPTVYFPLLVEEALMVEPTETETRETLDAFADAIAQILREAAAEGPALARAPRTRPRSAGWTRSLRPSDPSSGRRCHRCASSPASSPRAQSTWATTSARSPSTSPGRTAAKRSTASSICTPRPSPTSPPGCARACMT